MVSEVVRESECPLTISCGPWVWTLVGNSGPSFRHMKTKEIVLDLLGATHFRLKLAHKEKGPRIRDIVASVEGKANNFGWIKKKLFDSR